MKHWIKLLTFLAASAVIVSIGAGLAFGSGVDVRMNWGKRLEGDMTKPHEYMATAFR